MLCKQQSSTVIGTPTLLSITDEWKLLAPSFTMIIPDQEKLQVIFQRIQIFLYRRLKRKKILGYFSQNTKLW